MERFDVVVVGAGPAGSTAARFAAEGGARTLLLDHRPELGQPVQCGEFVPAPEELADLFGELRSIREAYQIPPETVLQESARMTCVAPSGRRYTFPLHGFSVARRAFDKRLALAAEGAGAELRFPAGVTGVRAESVRVAGAPEISARVIVGADGPLSTVGRSVGFAPRRELYRMITASADGPMPEEIELYFGGEAPGGYAWLFPRPGGANVGLGTARPGPGRELSPRLDRFLDRLGVGPATDRTRWWVPLGPPPSSLVRGRALFVGDAANLVMATNGGGIPTAILSGYHAGVAAAAHVRDGSPLAEYDRRWSSELAPPLARAWALQRWADRLASSDGLLSLGMRYLGARGLDQMMRLRWPSRLFGGAS